MNEIHEIISSRLLYGERWLAADVEVYLLQKKLAAYGLWDLVNRPPGVPPLANSLAAFLGLWNDFDVVGVLEEDGLISEDEADADGTEVGWYEITINEHALNAHLEKHGPDPEGDLFDTDFYDDCDVEGGPSSEE